MESGLNKIEKKLEILKHTNRKQHDNFVESIT